MRRWRTLQNPPRDAVTFWQFYLLAGAGTLCACLLMPQQRARHGLATGKYDKGHLIIAVFVVILGWPIVVVICGIVFISKLVR